MENLAPELRTPIREKGFDKARVGGEEMVYGALVAMMPGFSHRAQFGGLRGPAGGGLEFPRSHHGARDASLVAVFP